MTSTHPKVLSLIGYGWNINRNEELVNTHEQELQAHYGGFPWDMGLWDNGLLAETIEDSQGGHQAVGQEPWYKAVDGLSASSYDLLMICDGEFAMDPGEAAKVGHLVKEFIVGGKTIITYGNGLLLAALSQFGGAVGWTLTATGTQGLEQEYQTHGITWTTTGPGSPLSSMGEFQYPDRRRAVHTIKVITSDIDDSSLNVLMTDLLAVGVER